MSARRMHQIKLSPKTPSRKYHHHHGQSSQMMATEVPPAELSWGVEQTVGVSHGHHARELGEAMAVAGYTTRPAAACFPCATKAYGEKLFCFIIYSPCSEHKLNIDTMFSWMIRVVNTTILMVMNCTCMFFYIRGDFLDIAHACFPAHKIIRYNSSAYFF